VKERAQRWALFFVLLRVAEDDAVLAATSVNGAKKSHRLRKKLELGYSLEKTQTV